MRTFEEALIDQCAPTLAGIKPASFFRFRAESVATIRDAAAHWNRKLAPSGIMVRILKEYAASSSCMIYVDRESWVGELLRDRKISAFLAVRGYQVSEDVGQMLNQLSARFDEGAEFPHEIGVFLGYPLEDVVGFIEHRGRDDACCGCWKAYGHRERAERYFDCCRRCTAACQELHSQGVPVLLFTANVEVPHSAARESGL